MPEVAAAPSRERGPQIEKIKLDRGVVITTPHLDIISQELDVIFKKAYQELQNEGVMPFNLSYDAFKADFSDRATGPMISNNLVKISRENNYVGGSSRMESDKNRPNKRPDSLGTIDLKEPEKLSQEEIALIQTKSMIRLYTFGGIPLDPLRKKARSIYLDNHNQDDASAYITWYLKLGENAQNKWDKRIAEIDMLNNTGEGINHFDIHDTYEQKLEYYQENEHIYKIKKRVNS